jgi:hypothetical protein
MISNVQKGEYGMNFDEVFPQGLDLPGNPGYHDPDVKKNYVVVVLDKSGSMYSIKKEAIDFFNSQVVEARHAGENMINRICLIVFSSTPEILKWDVDADSIELLDENSYAPAGNTAMLDAVGMGITELQSLKDINDENVSVLFSIISDGFENASKEFTYESIKLLIDKMNSTGRCTFTYMGANQNLSRIKEMGIGGSNIAAFTSTREGTLAATQVHSMSTRTYYSARMTGTKAFTGDLECRGFYQDQNEVQQDNIDVASTKDNRKRKTTKKRS